MKTLVIHPKDSTTDFLSVIYKETDWTIVSENFSKSKLKKLIRDHDRIIMMGHGTEYGLIGYGYNYVIDSKWVYILREKMCAYIWCNANVFVDKYELKGFYTGMIISEIEEAYMYSVNFRDSAEITYSNELFADSLKNAINSDNILLEMRHNYTAETNPIIEFNKHNLYFNS